MTLSKIKTFASVAIIFGLAVFLFLQQQAQQKLRDENQLLNEQIARLKTETQRLSELSASSKDVALSTEQFKELLRLRGEVAKLREKQNAPAKHREPGVAQTPSTIEPVAQPSEAQPGQVIPRESWQFVGYATPESALQSAMWAMSKGDIQNVLNSLTPEGQEVIAKQYENKSEADIAASLVEQIAKIKSLTLVQRSVGPNGDVSLFPWSEEHDDGTNRTKDQVVLQFRNVGGEWKLTGF